MWKVTMKPETYYEVPFFFNFMNDAMEFMNKALTHAEDKISFVVSYEKGEEECQ